MTKDSFVDEVSEITGVGRKKAEALYAAGFHNVDQLKAASVDDMQKAEGVGPKVAQALYEHYHPDAAAAEAKPDEIEVVEAKPKTKGKDAKAKKKTEEKPEVVEPERAYVAKIKAEIPEELRKALEIRAIRLDQQPAFRKYHWWYSGGRVK